MGAIIAQHQIPQSWSWTKLSAIGTIINGDRGKNYPSRTHYVEQGIPFISAGNLDEGRIVLKSLNYIEPEKYNALRSGKLEYGDIIFCLRGTLGKCALYELDSYAAISSSLTILRLSNLVNKKYILYYLRSPFGLELVRISDNGTAQPNLSAESFKNFDVPIAPLQEQHCIVAKIEELFGNLDKGIERLEAAQQQLKIYRQSVLKWAFEGRLTNENCRESGLPNGWRWQQIGDVATSLDHLRKPINKKERSKRIGNIPYYGANGQTGWIDDYLFDEPLILVVEDETFTGRILPFSYKISGKSWVNNHAHILRPKENIDINFLNYQLWYYPFLPLTTGTTGRKKLTKNALMNAPIKICPIDEQRSIVFEIESRLTVCDKLEESILKGLQQAEALRESILKQAFEGKLLPKDPKDELSHALSEQIRSN